MITEFENLGLQTHFVQAIAQLGFEQPTPIQQSAIPLLLDGRNVIGQAQTGTGKTAAFALPMLQAIQPGAGAVQALVLAPTRELAIQVAEATERMGRHASIRVLAVYGGQSYSIQTRALGRGVDVVVGTPGRLLDLIRKEVLDLSQVRYLVLDEADEMLEMGFIEDVQTILEQTPPARQMALFSATMPEAVRKLAERYAGDAQRITINPKQLTVAETEQRYCLVRETDKLALLSRLLEMEALTRALIFVRTKARAQELAEELNRRGQAAESLHGDLNQAQREAVLKRFRGRSLAVLVATDVAARGLDVEDVSHVFNYDLPEDAEAYVHRIGRTGRAGRKGIAISFLTPREKRRLGQIQAYTHQALNEFPIPTREEVLARRDERFLARLTEQLSNGKITRQRRLIAQLEEAEVSLADIAAAAMHLARAGERQLALEDIQAPVSEKKARRPDKADKKKGAAVYKAHVQPPAAGVAQRLARWEKDQGEPGMVRLKMNLGKAHGVLPGDVVGAIASEAGIPGRAIGDILILKKHTFVDVAEKHVQQVLQCRRGQVYLRGIPALLTLAN